MRDKTTKTCPHCGIEHNRDASHCGSGRCKYLERLTVPQPCPCGRKGVRLENASKEWICQHCLDVEARNERVRAGVAARRVTRQAYLQKERREMSFHSKDWFDFCRRWLREESLREIRLTVRQQLANRHFLQAR